MYDICCGLGTQITNQHFSSNAVIEQVTVVVSEHEILFLCYVQMTFFLGVCQMASAVFYYPNSRLFTGHTHIVSAILFHLLAMGFFL